MMEPTLTDQQQDGAYERMLHIIGLSMDSSTLRTELSSLFQPHSADPETKTYSDSVYDNYYELGLSLMYVPESGYRPQSSNLDPSRLCLQSVDIYNSSTATRSEKRSYSPCPLLPLRVNTDDGNYFTITANTTGKEYVEALGEPPRKGGGEGPSSGSIDIWCEWPKYGLLVEFEARGPQAWEKGKDNKWKCITIFSPN